MRPTFNIWTKRIVNKLCENALFSNEKHIRNRFMGALFVFVVNFGLCQLNKIYPDECEIFSTVSIVIVWEYDHYCMDIISIEIYIYFVWVNPWCVNFTHTLLSTCDEPLDISEQCSIQAFILHLEGIIKLKILLFAQKKHAINTWHCM